MGTLSNDAEWQGYHQRCHRAPLQSPTAVDLLALLIPPLSKKKGGWGGVRC